MEFLFSLWVWGFREDILWSGPFGAVVVFVGEIRLIGTRSVFRFGWVCLNPMYSGPNMKRLVWSFM